jgi:DNA-binding MarR family transcriptional regulator
VTEFHEEEIARLRMALARISKQLNKRISSGDLTHTQLSVLGTVFRQGPIGVGELADVEGLNPTMLSRVLAKLEDNGLITREPAESDRRAIMVVATAAGRRKQTRLRAERTRILAEFVERLPAAEAALLLTALPSLERLGEVMTGETVQA